MTPTVDNNIITLNITEEMLAGLCSGQVIWFPTPKKVKLNLSMNNKLVVEDTLTEESSSKLLSEEQLKKVVSIIKDEANGESDFKFLHDINNYIVENPLKFSYSRLRILNAVLSIMDDEFIRSLAKIYLDDESYDDEMVSMYFYGNSINFTRGLYKVFADVYVIRFDYSKHIQNYIYKNYEQIATFKDINFHNLLRYNPAIKKVFQTCNHDLFIKLINRDKIEAHTIINFINLLDCSKIRSFTKIKLMKALYNNISKDQLNIIIETIVCS